MSSMPSRNYRATRETSPARMRLSSGSSSPTVLPRPPERQRIPQRREDDGNGTRELHCCGEAVEEVRDHEDGAVHGDSQTEETCDREPVRSLEEKLLIAVAPAQPVVGARRDQQSRRHRRREHRRVEHRQVAMREVRPTALERDREEECERTWTPGRATRSSFRSSINSRLCRCSSLSCTGCL